MAGSSKSISALNTEVASSFPDNTTGLITPALTRQMLLDMIVSYPNVINAVGVSGVDPTGSTDSLAGLQSALSLAAAAKLPLYIPSGTYLVSGTLTVSNHGQVIYGDGPGSVISATVYGPTVIRATSAALPIFSVGLAGGLRNVKIRGMCLDRTVVATLGGNGITQTSLVEECIFEDLYICNQYRGLSLTNTNWSNIKDILVTGSINDNIFMTNLIAAGSAPIQWRADNILTQLAGSRGWSVNSGGTSSQITLENWTNIFGFSNTLSSIAILGSVATPINGFRLHGAFLGTDGFSDLYIDSYGGFHLINDSQFELCATGNGVEVTANNTDVLISGCWSNGAAVGSGYKMSATTVNQLVSSRASNNANFGALFADGNKSVLTGCAFYANTNGNLSVTANAGGIVKAGNFPTGT